ncbi:MAG: arginine--tRNA ligase [Nanoarchaeota archaeon]|nr:arginine--tRNA ligase [Nanoarchaeota archaeon]
MDFKNKIIDLLKKETNLKQITLEIPPSESFGDYSFPCFQLSKQLKKSPNQIAENLSKKLKAQFIEKIETKGHYLNFFIKKELITKEVLTKPKSLPKKNKTILIESPGPNTNKPLHIGHLRNIALGISLSNIFKTLGNKTINVDIINDRGIHICKSMLAYKLYGKNKEPNKKPDHFVGDFYVLYSKKQSKESEKQIQEMLVKWENKDPETIKLWKKMNDWAIKGIYQTYKEFGLKIQKTYYESQHFNKGKKIVLDAYKKGLFEKDKEGAIIYNLEKEDLGKKILLRADGTSIYITQDIYLAKQRYEDYKFDKMIYIVATEQIYHFKVLFKVLKKLGYKFADNCYHLAYGMVNLPEGKMKSREGKVVDADDLIKNTTELAKKQIKKREKNISKQELEKRSKVIALGAIKFYLLKYDAKKDFTFNPEESISFEGETGPYIQYSYARASSILRKEKPPKNIDYSLLNHPIEISLIKQISQFPEVIQKAAKDLKPNLITNYTYNLAQKFNEYYHECNILKSEKQLKNARLNLISSVRTVISSSLNLLGIETLERM